MNKENLLKNESKGAYVPLRWRLPRPSRHSPRHLPRCAGTYGHFILSCLLTLVGHIQGGSLSKITCQTDSVVKDIKV
jgi:hypothetical protein